MEIINKALAFTKAELLALAEFAGDEDRMRYIRFEVRGPALCVWATDGKRALEVSFPMAVDERLPPAELGVDAAFLHDAAKLIQRPDAERVAIALDQLLVSASSATTPAIARILDIENTKDGKAVEQSVLTRKDAVNAQLELRLDGLRQLMAPAPATTPVQRSVCLQPRYLAALQKVANGAKSQACRVHMPPGGLDPALVVFTSAATGATWTVLVMPMHDEVAEVPDDRLEEAAELGGLQSTIDDLDPLHREVIEALDEVEPARAQLVRGNIRVVAAQQKQRQKKHKAGDGTTAVFEYGKPANKAAKALLDKAAQKKHKAGDDFALEAPTDTRTPRRKRPEARA